MDRILAKDLDEIWGPYEGKGGRAWRSQASLGHPSRAHRYPGRMALSTLSLACWPFQPARGGRQALLGCNNGGADNRWEPTHMTRNTRILTLTTPGMGDKALSKKPYQNLYRLRGCKGEPAKERVEQPATPRLASPTWQLIRKGLLEIANFRWGL